MAIGRPDPERLLDELTSAQVAHWLAYEAVEGSLGPRGDWERAAQTLALLANVNRDTKLRPEPFQPRDFLPWVERPRMTEKTFRAMFAGRIQRKGAKK